MHLSPTNARAFHLHAAREADARDAAAFETTYRGVRVEAVRESTLVLSGGALRADDWCGLTLHVSSGTGGPATAVPLAPATVLRSFEEATGYAMGAVDALLREAAEREPAHEADRYRAVQQRFHQLGRALFDGPGRPGWDAVRPRLVREYTAGRLTSSRALEASELMFFVARFEAELGEAAPLRLAA